MRTLTCHVQCTQEAVKRTQEVSLCALLCQMSSYAD